MYIIIMAKFHIHKLLHLQWVQYSNTINNTFIQNQKQFNFNKLLKRPVNINIL